MSSGSYHPPPVLRVEIEKPDGGVRPLGIPTVADRIAQMVVKLQIEPELERHFHPDSYGYLTEYSVRTICRRYCLSLCQRTRGRRAEGVAQ
jgi:RNA-directed DNA polymerase